MAAETEADAESPVRFFERREGLTPNGGVVSVAYWRDAAGNRCTRDEARSAEIVELDAAGNELARTYAEMRPTP